MMYQFSHNDVWAVGYFCCSGDEWGTGLIEHWDGNQWSISSSPRPPGNALNYLEAVATISSDDVWAIGFYGTGGLTLTEHYAPPSECHTPSPSPPPIPTYT